MNPIEVLQLEHDYKAAAAALKKQCADRSHVDQTIDKNTLVITPNGDITALLIKQQIMPQICRRAYKDWVIVNDLVDNRSTAVGTTSLPRLRKDGSPGKRRGVAKNILEAHGGARQGILGHLDEPCRETPLSRRHPELLYRNEYLVTRVNRFYERYLPTPYAKQLAEIEKASFWWRLWDTVFSTIYIAKNFRTAYHYDTGNLRGVMTALLVMGSFTGGELVLPRWRIAFALKPGDLLFFDPQQLHGNLPFEGERLSAAFFCARHIADCGK